MARAATRSRHISVTPSARRLTTSLRDIGYDFDSAVADLVDNSISAGAKRVDIEVEFDGENSFLLIADDGSGMTEDQLDEAMRFGSRREYACDQLGKYGLGLKTASLSQSRRFTVVTRTAPRRLSLRMRTLDLDHVARTDRWEVLAGGPPDKDYSWAPRALAFMSRGPGTVVVWDRLDRLFPDSGPTGGWAKRRLDNLSRGLHQHLGMIFHRFIEGSAIVSREQPLVITINGEKVEAWNPFAIDEEETIALPPRSFEIEIGHRMATLTFTPYVLPTRSLFSSLEAFDRMSGPAKWARQQGFYVYRSDRLVQSGGWAGLRNQDEHTKLARAAIDFGPLLDEAFRINVAKMRVSLPPDVRSLLETEVTALCKRAEAMYRRDLRDGSSGDEPSDTPPGPATGSPRRDLAFTEVSNALLASAIATGTSDELMTIVEHLRVSDPELATRLGW